MNISISELISQIVEGLKNYFEVTQIQVNENFYEELFLSQKEIGLRLQ